MRSWGGPLSDFTSALGGKSFEGTLGPNGTVQLNGTEYGDSVARVACIQNNGNCTDSVAVTLQALDGIPVCSCATTTVDQYFAAQ